MEDLLRSISWHAEKQFRRHDGLPVILWVTEDSKGRRELWDRWCQVPASVASDAEVLTALAEEMSEDFAKAGIVRFGIAYLAKRVTVIRPVDPDSSIRPTTTKRQGVVIEVHSVNASVQPFREIIRPPRGKPVLGAPDTLDASATGSPYAAVLQRAASAAGITLW